MRKTLVTLLAVAALSAVAHPARTADQPTTDLTVVSQVVLNGFNNSSIYAGFSSADSLDTMHVCSPGSTSSCIAKTSYSAPQKSIGNFLCIPNSIIYSLTPACASGLEQGASQGCTKNSNHAYCSRLSPDSSEVASACNWLTVTGPGQAQWNWFLTLQQGVVIVDCPLGNYSGPEPP